MVNKRLEYSSGILIEQNFSFVNWSLLCLVVVAIDFTKRILQFDYLKFIKMIGTRIQTIQLSINSRVKKLLKRKKGCLFFNHVRILNLYFYFHRIFCLLNLI